MISKECQRGNLVILSAYRLEQAYIKLMEEKNKMSECTKIAIKGGCCKQCPLFKGGTCPHEEDVAAEDFIEAPNVIEEVHEKALESTWVIMVKNKEEL